MKKIDLNYERTLYEWDLINLPNLHEQNLKLPLDLDQPKTFSEKLQWLKLNFRDPFLSKLVDKVLVRDYVKELIGEEYLIPVFGIYESVDEFELALESLPDKFVVKANHWSGGNIIIYDKNSHDWESSFTKLRSWLSGNYYFKGNGEWIYKDVKPKLIVEEFLSDEGREVEDYKVFCFGDHVEFIQVDTSRSINHTQAFYSTSWKRLNIKASHAKQTRFNIDKPERLNDLIDLSKKLSSKLPHVRVDFYIVCGKVFFGEITIFHHSGLPVFTPSEINQRLGSLVDITNVLDSKIYKNNISILLREMKNSVEEESLDFLLLNQTKRYFILRGKLLNRKPFYLRFYDRIKSFFF